MPVGSGGGEGGEPTTIRVGLGSRAYDIIIGAGLIDAAGRFIGPQLSRPTAAVVTDETVAQLHLPRLEAALAAEGISIMPVVIPAGEASKSLDQVGRVVGELLDAGIERRDLVIALGGGVVGDLAGFAAAVIHRGIRYAQIPTTLLAQVDSSVGGKTGVNAAQGKNLIGAFHQPVVVLADTGTLATLPPREFRAGYAEVVKYGLIADRQFFDWLAVNRDEIFAGGAALGRAIAESCRAKARVVEQDEREGGARRLLNLGHTFGHVLEASLGYSGELLHGEAVAIGMCLAFELSARQGLCSKADVETARDHIAAAGLPTSPAPLANRLGPAEHLLALMAHDKKIVAGRKTLILVHAIGEAFATDQIDDQAILEVLGDALNP